MAQKLVEHKYQVPATNWAYSWLFGGTESAISILHF